MSKAERPARQHGLIFYIVSLVIAEFIILMVASVRGVIGMMIAIAGGVGYWFLIRRFWRRLASDSPDSGFVRGGLRMSPPNSEGHLGSNLRLPAANEHGGCIVRFITSSHGELICRGGGPGCWGRRLVQ